MLLALLLGSLAQGPDGVDLALQAHVRRAHDLVRLLRAADPQHELRQTLRHPLQIQQPGICKEGYALLPGGLGEDRVGKGALGHIGHGYALLSAPAGDRPHVLPELVHVHDQPWIAHRPMLLFISVSASFGYALDITPREAMI